MSVKDVIAPCPRCGFEKARWLEQDKNGNFPVSCAPRPKGCDFQAAANNEKAKEVLSETEYKKLVK